MSLQRHQNNKKTGKGALPSESSKRYTQRLESILAKAVKDLRLGGASIYLLNEARDHLRAHISVDKTGRGMDVTDEPVAFSKGDRLNEMIEGRTESESILHDGDDSTGNPDTAVPISVDDQVIGMLTASHPAGEAPVANQLQSLGMVATEAAFVLDRRHSEERMAEESRHEHALFEVSKAISSALDPNHILELVAELMAKGIASDKSAVYVWERDLDQLRRRASYGTFKKTDKKYSAIPFLSESVISQRLSDNEAVQLEEDTVDALDSDLRAAIDSNQAITVPLMSKNRLVAVAIVGCPTECDTFDQDDVDLLMAIAAQAAVSIENATLYEAQNRAVTELAALYAVSQALAASLNLNDGLQIVAESIAAVTGVSRCGVFLIE
ncbi:MAG: GAF domain-containing protein, partial [Armatimonadota bacterium]